MTLSQELDVQSLQNKYEDCVYTLHSVQRLIINGQPIWTLSIESGPWREIVT